MARIVLHAEGLVHSEYLLLQLHWLNSPQQLAIHIHYHEPVCSLLSSNQHYLLSIPFSTNFDSRSFRSADLVNLLSSTSDTFKCSLKHTTYASLLSKSSSVCASDAFMTHRPGNVVVEDVDLSDHFLLNWEVFATRPSSYSKVVHGAAST